MRCRLQRIKKVALAGLPPEQLSGRDVVAVTGFHKGTGFGFCIDKTDRIGVRVFKTPYRCP